MSVGHILLTGGPRDGLLVRASTLPGTVICIAEVDANMRTTEHRYVVKEDVVLADQTWVSHTVAVYSGVER